MLCGECGKHYFFTASAGASRIVASTISYAVDDRCAACECLWPTCILLRKYKCLGAHKIRINLTNRWLPMDASFAHPSPSSCGQKHLRSCVPRGLLSRPCPPLSVVRLHCTASAPPRSRRMPLYRRRRAPDQIPSATSTTSRHASPASAPYPAQEGQDHDGAPPKGRSFWRTDLDSSPPAPAPARSKRRGQRAAAAPRGASDSRRDLGLSLPLKRSKPQLVLLSMCTYIYAEIEDADYRTRPHIHVFSAVSRFSQSS